MSGRYWYTDSNGKRKRTAAGVKHEYDKFQSSESAKKDRASRNAARRSAKKNARVSARQDVHHKNGDPTDNRPSNLSVISRSKNRGIREKSRKRGSRRARWK